MTYLPARPAPDACMPESNALVVPASRRAPTSSPGAPEARCHDAPSSGADAFDIEVPSLRPRGLDAPGPRRPPLDHPPALGPRRDRIAHRRPDRRGLRAAVDAEDQPREVASRPHDVVPRAVVLLPHARGYKPWREQFGFLFNDRHDDLGPRIAREQRGLISRPTLEEVLTWRSHVNDAIAELLSARWPQPKPLLEALDLALHHEQQHQERLLADLKHLWFGNPLRPVYRPVHPGRRGPRALQWFACAEGLRDIGHAGEGFAFDNELPTHRQYLRGFELGSRLVTCGEYLDFMDDRGYYCPELWMADGINHVRRLQWTAPLYWERQGRKWLQFTLSGLREVDPDEPVCHLSWYEADAYARLLGRRAAAHRVRMGSRRHRRRPGWQLRGVLPIPSDAAARPACRLGPRATLRRRLGMDVEPARALPRLPPGGGAARCPQRAVHGQPVRAARRVRVTPQGAHPDVHAAPSLAATRWQFSGIRLARDVERSHD